MRSFRVHTDPNLLTPNHPKTLSFQCVKYTQKGRVLLKRKPRSGRSIFNKSGHWRWDSSRQNKKKIFDDFYRWENRKNPAMGLGLWFGSSQCKSNWELATENTFNTRQRQLFLALKIPWAQKQ